MAIITTEWLSQPTYSVVILPPQLKPDVVKSDVREVDYLAITKDVVHGQKKKAPVEDAFSLSAVDFFSLVDPCFRE